jgi:outer membrane immunogenic protein
LEGEWELKVLLLTSTAVMLSGPAFAADLPARMPAKAPIATSAPVSWTGCYVGAHAGAGWGRTVIFDPNANGSTIGHFAPTPGDTINIQGTGAIVGGQIGCDYQFATNWVVGFAGDFSWAKIDGQTNDPFFGGKDGVNPLTLEAHTNFLASTTGRVGYAWDHYLLYAKGGVAWSHNKYTINNFGCVFLGGACYANASETRIGWTAGGGFEWSFAPNWSVLAEYDHYGFGTKSVTFFDAGQNVSVVFDVKPDIDVVKVGLNYRFSGVFR